MVPINDLNKAGGVFGKKIKLATYDDSYTPTLASTGTKRLIEQDHIFAWVGGVGTPTYLAIVPLLDEAKIPAITPFAPARDIGTMKHPYTYMTWANFNDEYYQTAAYLVDKEGMGAAGGTVAFVRFNTQHGEDARDGTNRALAKVGAKVILDVPTTPDQTDYSGVALQVKNSGAKFLGWQLSSENGGNMLKAMKEIGYQPKKFTQSDYSDASFVKNFPDVSEGVYGGLQTRVFETPPNAVLKKHIDELKAATGHDMTTWRAVGFTQGLLAVEAFKKMKAPTRECLIEALQTIKDFDTGIQGLITFGPEVRMGMHNLGVFQIQSGKVLIVKPNQG
jgi:branched-chain amino acid transport system substrate-binding protein